MHWSPFLNAAGAAVYIWAVALLFQFLQTFRGNTPDTLLDPIGALSLLVFSVALMAFLFFYRPLVLLIDNKRKEAVSFFLKTLAIFGAIMLLVFGIVFVL